MVCRRPSLWKESEMSKGLTFSLNRIACPGLPLPAFFKLAREAGVAGVELRNDLAGGSITDGLPPAGVRKMAGDCGLSIFTINALQKFNLADGMKAREKEIDGLLRLAKDLGCMGVVLCPNNDTADRRSRDRMFAETVAALKVFRRRFEDSGITGLVEPLGFAECSLRSAKEAVKAIEESGGKRYRLVHDTFHYFLGPDSLDELTVSPAVKHTGWVHASGVESGIEPAKFRDPHRVLVSKKDRLQSREQIGILAAAGYAGPISFEPFAAEVQALPAEKLLEALRASIRYLSE